MQTWPDKLAKLTTSLIAQGLLNPKSELGSLSDAQALIEKQLEKTDEVIVNYKNCDCFGLVCMILNVGGVCTTACR